MHRTKLLTLSFAILAIAACGGDKVAGTAGGDSGMSGDSDNTGGQSFTATIVRPNGSLTILTGDTVDMEAEFFRGATRVFPTVVSWDASGLFLGDGNPLVNQSLADGDHLITVTATLDGQTATDSVTVSVGNMAARIRNPDNGTAEDEGSNIRFRGEAVIIDGGTINLPAAGAIGTDRNATYAWSSDLDGAFGTSSDDFNYDLLSIGAHTITLTVTDDDVTAGTGSSASASISLTIRPPNTTPTVTITDPAACPVELEAGATLTFTGTVTDPDAADAGLTGSWTDSADGSTSAGNSLSFSSSGLGLHNLIFSATDSQGATDQAVCDVWVVAVGGSQADFFPDTTPVNDNLPGGNNNVNWVGTDADGTTWLGTDGGIGTYDGSNNVIDEATGDEITGGGGGVNINDVAFGGSGSAVVATDSGAYVCAYAAGVLTVPCTQVDGQDYDAIDVSGDPAADGLIAAGRDGSLYIAQTTGGTVTSDAEYDPNNSNMPDNRVRDVLFVGSTLYVGTDSGLCVVTNPAAAAADTLGAEPLCTEIISANNSLLPDDEVRALVADGTTLWIGTADGLVQYDTVGGGMVIWDDDSGLADNDVNDVAIDAAGIIWVATGSGLSRIDPTTGSVTNITGQAWIPTTQDDRVNSVYIDGNGVKWLATENGIVMYSGT